MFDRTLSWTPKHSAQVTGLPFLGVLVLLALTASGMEARADDEQSVSSLAAQPPATLQVARSPSSVEYQEETASVSYLTNFDAARPLDEMQPVSPGLNLDISFEQAGDLEETIDDKQQNSARVARIASCYEASVGRYHSEERSEERGAAFTNPLSRTTELDTAMTRFTAQRASRRQFDTCSR